MDSAATESVRAAVEAYNSKLTQVQPRALAISVGTMTGATLLVSIAFNLLRSMGSNEKVYATRLYCTAEDKAVPWAPSKEPERKQRWYSWIFPLLHTPEDVLFDVIGLDAVTFLRLQRLVLVGFAGTALLACAVLIPTDIVYNIRHIPSGDRNALSMLTSSDVRGNYLFAHIVVAYLIDAFFLYLIWQNEHRIVQLRQRWFQQTAEQDHLFARSLSIIRIPEELNIKTDEDLGAFIAKLGLPHSATSFRLGRAIGDLPSLVKDHDELVVKLEKALTKYLRGGKLGSKRPLFRVGDWKFLPVGGVKVDAISYFTERIEGLEGEIEGLRVKLDEETPANYGFVSFASVSCAHRNMYHIDSHRQQLKPILQGAKVAHSPHPKDIVWENIEDKETTQDNKSRVGVLLLAFVFAWWTLPVLVLSFLANLANASAFVPFLADWQRASNGTFSAVSGILPPAVAALFAMLLPLIIRAISRFRGSTTTTELDRLVCSRLFDFTFTFASQLIVFSCITIIFNLGVGMLAQLGQGTNISQLFHMLDDLPVSVSSTYQQEWIYWTTWLPSRGFAAVFDLAQLINLVIVQGKSFLLGRRRTPREAREWMRPKRFKFEIYTSNLLFLACVGLAYAVLAPVVAAVAFVVLGIWTLVYRYQLMFVFETPAGLESGGRLWPIMVNRLLVALCFSNILVTLTIALTRSWFYFFFLGPTIMAIILFKLALTRRFGKGFKYYLPEAEEHATTTHAGDERKKRLARRFEHPAMSAQLFTPMIATELAPLIPEVYEGNVKTARPVDDKKFSGTKLPFRSHRETSQNCRRRREST